MLPGKPQLDPFPTIPPFSAPPENDRLGRPALPLTPCLSHVGDGPQRQEHGSWRRAVAKSPLDDLHFLEPVLSVVRGARFGIYQHADTTDTLSHFTRHQQDRPQKLLNV